MAEVDKLDKENEESLIALTTHFAQVLRVLVHTSIHSYMYVCIHPHDVHAA